MKIEEERESVSLEEEMENITNQTEEGEDIREKNTRGRRTHEEGEEHDVGGRH